MSFGWFVGCSLSLALVTSCQKGGGAPGAGPTKVGPCSAQSATTCPAGQVCDLANACIPPRYTTNADGTVTDDATGLSWQQTLGNPACSLDTDGLCTWADATTYCQMLALGSSGQAWRLPTLDELFTLVDIGSVAPMIDMNAFPYAPGEAYWTSELADPTDAWDVDFANGTTGTTPTDTGIYVRCVQ